jgi:hypothetical protein
MLKKCISGCQDGADAAALITAKEFGLETGGTMPKGFITLSGSKPEYAELYGVKEHSSSKYPPRTEENIMDSDGTIRFAFNFDSPGEVLTKRLTQKHMKPCRDIFLGFAKDERNRISKTIEWLDINLIETLNVAGNTDEKTFELTQLYLTKLFTKLGFKNV